jgi:hypothetical protein
MRGNIRYLDFTSKVHLKGALGYISLGGSGGLLVLASLCPTQPLATSPPSLTPQVPTSPNAPAIPPYIITAKYPPAAVSIVSPTLRENAHQSPRHCVRLHPTTIRQARSTFPMATATPFLPAIGHRVQGSVTFNFRPPPHPHAHPSLQLHFCLLSLPLLAVFLLIGLTETKAKKGINSTSLTNLNISPRIALWR